MEDGVGDICSLDGRNGYWYTVGDSTSTMLDPAQEHGFPADPDPRGAGKSRYAARFTGSSFTAWGAFMGFDFQTQGTATKTYDASSVGGITFWMKSNVPVSVEFLIPETVLLKNGGSCVVSATNPNCDSNFAFQVTGPSPDWTQYNVPFAALTQLNGGTATWNPQQLLGVEFLARTGSGVRRVGSTTSASISARPAAANRPASIPLLHFLARRSANYPAACRPAGWELRRGHIELVLRSTDD